MQRPEMSPFGVPLTPPGLYGASHSAGGSSAFTAAHMSKMVQDAFPTAGAHDLKLFVGGISWETTESSLRAHFSRYGDIIDCVLMTNKLNGAPRGFAFVTYSESGAVSRVLLETHELDGRVVEVKRAIPKDDSKDRIVPSATKLDRRKVFVGGLASTVTEGDLRAYFGHFGTVLDASVMIDRTTNRSRGFGFVTFGTYEAVDAVLRCLHRMHDKLVEVKPAQPRTDRDFREMYLPYGDPYAGGYGHMPGAGTMPYRGHPSAHPAMEYSTPIHAPPMAAPSDMMPPVPRRAPERYGYGTPPYDSYGHMLPMRRHEMPAYGYAPEVSHGYVDVPYDGSFDSFVSRDTAYDSHAHPLHPPMTGYMRSSTLERYPSSTQSAAMSGLSRETAEYGRSDAREYALPAPPPERPATFSVPLTGPPISTLQRDSRAHVYGDRDLPKLSSVLPVVQTSNDFVTSFSGMRLGPDKS